MDVLPFVVLGAIMGLDVVSFPQMMFSRPVVASTVAGAFAGDAERGLAIGAILEVVALGTLPFGASRYPEWGSAAVVGGALHASGVTAPVGSLAIAVLAALATAWLSGESMVIVRKLNGRWIRMTRPAIEAGDPDPVTRVHLRSLAADACRAALVTGVGIVALLPAHRALTRHWDGGPDAERFVLACITSAFAGATTWLLVRGATGAFVGVVLGLTVGIVIAL
jgi:PTS system mannose-specific IIC component